MKPCQSTEDFRSSEMSRKALKKEEDNRMVGFALERGRDKKKKKKKGRKLKRKEGEAQNQLPYRITFFS